jgi:hypothetical protein
MRRPGLPRRGTPEAALAWIALGLAVLVVAFVVLLWALGVFDFHKKATAANAQVYAAVLGLVGAFFGTAFTFVAALLKHSIDVRNVDQARETEQRLRLETSIRAVELLTEQGKKAPPTRQAGSLFVLGSLDQLDFALALLGEIWPKRHVSPGAAVWVVNRALESGDEQIQTNGALVLLANADKLKDTWVDSCWEWPPCLTVAWTNDIAVGAREVLLNALLKVLQSKPKNQWGSGCINTFLVHLDLIRQIDEAPYIANGAALAEDFLLGTDEYAMDFVLFTPLGEMQIAELRAQVAKHVLRIGDDIASAVVQAVDALRAAWSEPGAAAPAVTPMQGLPSVAPTPASTPDQPPAS